MINIRSMATGLEVVGRAPEPPSAGEIAQVDKTGIVANIGTTTLANAPRAGVYVIAPLLACSIIGSGSVTLNVTFTDDVGLTTQVVTTLNMTGLNRSISGYALYSLSGNISYSTTNYVAGTYELRLRCFYLG